MSASLERIVGGTCIPLTGAATRGIRLRSIVHLDADAFFASVEQSADSRLRGRPVAVGGQKRGVIASASYEARKFGIYTPMATALARRLCPKLILLPGDFEKYELFSRLMFSYAYDFTPDVEIGSIDEGYFDLTGTRRPAVDIAERIRQAIRQSLKLPVSEGIGGNKLVSQIASKLKKPSAFQFVCQGTEADFLAPLENKWLPGVGPQTARQLNSAGLARIGQVARTPPDLLGLLVGGLAAQLGAFARGVDDRPIVPVRAPAKSYGQQETFAADTTDEAFLDAVLRRMADKLMAKVRADGKSIRTVTVKVRYNDMDEQQAGDSLEEPSDLETDIYSLTSSLLRKAWQRRVSLRLVSLKLSNLYDGRFSCGLALDTETGRRVRQQRLADVVDQLREKFGNAVLLRGHDFTLRARNGQGREPTLSSTGTPGSVCCSCPRLPARQTTYVPLNVHSYYSFLNSTLSVKAVVDIVRRHGLPAIALTDRNNLHGAVEFAQAAAQAGIKPIIGAELDYHGQRLCLYVQNQAGYRNLCQILNRLNTHPEAPISLSSSGGKRGLISPLRRRTPSMVFTESGETEGLLAVSSSADLARYFPGRFYLGIDRLEALERCTSPLPCVMHFPVCYELPADRWKFDIVQSIRTLTLLREKHPDKQMGGHRHFLPVGEVQRLCADHPELLAHTLEIAERCSFAFSLGKPQFPGYSPADGSTPAAFLHRLVMEGLRRRYPGDYSRLQPQVELELAIITEVGYEEYFLVMWDILQECQRRGIEWITRGSAADSLACYCLGISGVCPIRFDLYFRRFLNRERMAMQKLPDIDVDFPHDRKDDVVDLIFEKYGPSNTAIVGGFSTFQSRSAFAEVAKVLGVSDHQVRRITERFPFAHAKHLEEAVAMTQECRDLPLEQEPYATAMKMAQFLDGFPRYPKMHPCGVVLSRQPMHEVTPCFTSAKGYPTTHFDMDSVEAIGLVKMDILAQGGLAAMRDVKAMVEQENIEAPGRPAINLEALAPWGDPQVWDLIASGSARAVHHIESPAMVSLCKMCNVRDIDTLIAIVSVIRPGAANESKKMEFARRYQGLSPVRYPHPSLANCLRSTYGLVVYEEHILQICEAFAGLPPGRADILRRALGKDKTEIIEQIHTEFMECARRQGRTEAEIGEVWDLVSGFRGYAFCKAHSTAYGVEAYQAAWLKRYYPAEFMAAVLTNDKGFYHPLVYILECHRLGIPLLPPSVNQPGPHFTVSNGQIRVPALRIKGLSERTSDIFQEARKHGAFTSLTDFFLRVQPLPEEMENLIRVGAFDEFGLSRTKQYWEFRALVSNHSGTQPIGAVRPSGQAQLWLLPPGNIEHLPEVPLDEPSRFERLRAEEELFGYPVSAHPLELFPDIAWETYCPINRLDEHLGEQVVTCGLVIEQRLFHQVTGEPMKFLTIADRTGVIETELFAQTYRSFGLTTIRYRALAITATVEPFENGRGHSLRVLRADKPRARR